jgi:succinyl-CoA synthetase alpha subunit
MGKGGQQPVEIISAANTVETAVQQETVSAVLVFVPPSCCA